MKQTMEISIDSIEFKGVKLGGIRVNGTAEYSAEEMSVEGDVVNQVIDKLCERFSWVKPFVEAEIKLSLRKEEALTESFEKMVKEGRIEAYGPRGWSIKSTTTTSEDYDPNKSYAPSTTIKKK